MLRGISALVVITPPYFADEVCHERFKFTVGILAKTKVSAFPDLLMCGAHPVVFIWIKRTDLCRKILLPAGRGLV